MDRQQLISSVHSLVRLGVNEMHVTLAKATPLPVFKIVFWHERTELLYGVLDKAQHWHTHRHAMFELTIPDAHDGAWLVVTHFGLKGWTPHAPGGDVPAYRVRLALPGVYREPRQRPDVLLWAPAKVMLYAHELTDTVPPWPTRTRWRQGKWVPA